MRERSGGISSPQCSSLYSNFSNCPDLVKDEVSSQICINFIIT